MEYDLDHLRRQMEAKLSPGRYRHSLAVQKQAETLARRFGADRQKAGVAGLVHDCCKDMEPRELLKYLESCGILLDILTRGHPQVWHAIAGAAYARRELAIRDEEILGAIRYHTTGRADMSLLEKVVYVADLSSEDREYPDVDTVREMAGRSLDEAVRYCQIFIMGRMVRGQRSILRDAWEAYNHYLQTDLS